MSELEIILQNPHIISKVHTFCYKGHFFSLNVIKVEDYWHFVIMMFETAEVCENFNVEIEVYEADSSPETRHSAKVRCNPCSIDINEDQLYGCGLLVHHEFMKKMMRREDRFNLTSPFSEIFLHFH